MWDTPLPYGYHFDVFCYLLFLSGLTELNGLLQLSSPLLRSFWRLPRLRLTNMTTLVHISLSLHAAFDSLALESQ